MVTYLLNGRYTDVAGYAEKSGLSVDEVREQCQNGELVAIKVGPEHFKFWLIFLGA